MGKYNRFKESGSADIDNILTTGAIIFGILFFIALIVNSGYLFQKNREEKPAPLPKGNITINGFTTPYFEDEWGRYTNLQVKECYNVNWAENEICDKEIKKVYFE